MVSEAENVPKSAQILQAFILGPFNMIYGSAESSFLLENEIIIHDTKLWDGKHYVLSLSGHFGLLKTNTKMLSSSLKCLATFVK